MSEYSFLTWLFFEDKHRALALELENWAETELAVYSSAPANVDLASGNWYLSWLTPAGWIIV